MLRKSFIGIMTLVVVIVTFNSIAGDPVVTPVFIVVIEPLEIIPETVVGPVSLHKRKVKTLVTDLYKKRLFYTEADVIAMALNLYHEARGESYKGILAAAEVVLNRVNDSRWPNTIKEVIYQTDQFSWTCDKLSDVPKDISKYIEMYDLAYLILERHVESDYVPFANHYHHLSVDPKWSARKDAIARVGQHIFYKF